MHVQDLSQSTLATSGHSIQLYPRCGHMTNPKGWKTHCSTGSACATDTTPCQVQEPPEKWKSGDRKKQHDAMDAMFLLLILFCSCFWITSLEIFTGAFCMFVLCPVCSWQNTHSSHYTRTKKTTNHDIRTQGLLSSFLYSCALKRLGLGSQSPNNACLACLPKWPAENGQPSDHWAIGQKLQPKGRDGSETASHVKSSMRNVAETWPKRRQHPCVQNVLLSQSIRYVNL